MGQRITHISAQHKLASYLQELRSHWQFLYFLVWKELKVRYRSPLLGILWTSAQPVMYGAAMLMAHRFIAENGDDRLPFPLFIFSGIIFWQFFSSVVNGTVQVLLSNAGIIRKVYFPKFLIPISAGIIGISETIPGILLWFILLIFYGYSISVAVLVMLFFGLLITLVSAIGTAGILSIGVFKYPSLRHAIPLFLHLLLFVCPILYSMDGIPSEGIIGQMIMIIPISAPIESLRAAVSGELVFGTLGLAGIVSVFLFTLGFVAYFFSEDKMADHA